MTAREQWEQRQAERLCQASLRCCKQLTEEALTYAQTGNFDLASARKAEFDARNQEFLQNLPYYVKQTKPYPKWLIPHLPPDINEPMPSDSAPSPAPPAPGQDATMAARSNAPPDAVVPKSISHPMHVHPLNRGAPGAGWNCDGCLKTGFSATTLSWNCRKCNFDMCDKCMSAFQGNSTTVQPQPPQQSPQQAASRGLPQQSQPPQKPQVAANSNFFHENHDHPLSLSAAPYPWNCKVCDSTDNLAVVPRWNCSPCKYDICTNCIGIAASARSGTSAPTRGNIKITTSHEAAAAFVRSIGASPVLPQVPPSAPIALRIQFLYIENVPGKPSDPYLRVRVSSWEPKREHVTKKVGIAGGKEHTRSATFGVKSDESIEIEVWEKNMIRDKKLGTISYPAAQWRNLRPTQEIDVSLPIAGGGVLVCKVLGLSAGTCGILQPFPSVPESEVRLLADKVAKETGGLKSGFAIKEMQVAALLPIDAIRFELRTWEETRYNIAGEYAFQSQTEFDTARIACKSPKPPPDPWVHVPRLPEIYTDHKEIWPLWQTQEIHQCRPCNGRGQVRCGNCGGAGEVPCNGCGGSGQVSEFRQTSVWNGQNWEYRTDVIYVTCYGCGGQRYFCCDPCRGSGQVMCLPCYGFGAVLFLYSVVFEWRVWQVASAATYQCFDAGDDKLSQEELLKVKGPIIWQDEAHFYREPPASLPSGIRITADAAIAQAMQGVQKSKGLVHRQTFLLRAIPVTQCVYEHPDKEEQRSLWILGEEKSPSCPAYPRNVLGSVFGASKQANVSAATLASQTDYNSYKLRATKVTMMYKHGGITGNSLELRELMLADHLLLWFNGKKQCKALQLSEMDPTKVQRLDATVAKKNTAFSAKPSPNNADQLVFWTVKKKYSFVLAKSEGGLEEWRTAIVEAILKAKDAKGRGLLPVKRP